MKQLLIVGILVALGLSATSSVQAFSVGDIEIKSRLGMPFVAEVQLEMKPHERGEGFVVVIGDAADYESERLPRAPVIDQLWPTVIMGPPDVIRVVSREVVETASFDLVLFVRTGQVTIVRSYPITLPTAAPTAIMAARPQPAQSAAQTVQPRAVAPAVSASQLAGTGIPQLPARYGPVLRGESLYKIMKRLEIPKGLIWPMAVLTWKHNVKQFARENIHGLRAGVYLDLPDAASPELANVDEHTAQQIVAEQWDTWRHPKSRSPKTDEPVVASHAPATEALVAWDETEEELTGAADGGLSQEVVVPSEPQVAKVSRAKLDSVLTDLEQRLAQRFSLPALTPDETDDTTVTFVSSNDLQTAIEGLEIRLTQHLEQAIQDGGKVGAFFGRPHVLATPTPLGSQAGFSLGSWLGANSMMTVLLVQNVMLVVLGVGFVWFWYRKRT